MNMSIIYLVCTAFAAAGDVPASDLMSLSGGGHYLDAMASLHDLPILKAPTPVEPSVTLNVPDVRATPSSLQEAKQMTCDVMLMSDSMDKQLYINADLHHNPPGP